MSTELTVLDRAKKALRSTDHEPVLMELLKQTADITTIKNADGRTQAHSSYMALKNRRTDIRRVGKEARDDATKFSKAVIAEEDRLVAIIEPEEARLQNLRDTWDAAREAERREKAQAAQRRKDEIRDKISQLRSIPVNLVDATPDRIANAIGDVEAFEVSAAEFDDQIDAAHLARTEVIAKLRDMYASAVRRAEEAAQLAAERAEFDRQRAEQAERDRKASEAREVEDALVESIWKNARRIESNTPPYILKSIGIFESMAKDWENDPRQRISGAIASAREEMQMKLRSAQEAEDRAANEARARAEREAEQRVIDEQRADIARQQAAIDAERQRIADEEAARQRAADEAAAAAQRERDEAARIEAARIRAEQEAAAAEQKRRERAQFELNGPTADEMVAVLAKHYGVSEETALYWINLHVWAEVEVAA